MKRLFLNNEEIFVSRYFNSIDTLEEGYELLLSISIKDAKIYHEACKLKNIKPGDILKFSVSNALVRIDTELEITEVISYYMTPDDFLDEVSRMCFKFKIKKEMTESVKDLSSNE